ncbi:MAG TPA: MFS transporter [Gemmatimonadales bacterium]|jgi:DHA2 family multidrug resistance protein-like MFS transporter|nr:MFS transporter [Gemmatimonadales bacterium]
MGESITAATPKAGKREWIGLAVIALPCLLYSMDLTVLHLAVPRLTEALAPSSVQLLWIIDIYGFLLAGSLITMGTLGDRIGRRRLLLIGAVLFGAASILAAFSRSAAMLIVSRAVLGLAGATIAPSTLSLIRNMFLDPRERTTAISIWIIAFSLGGAIGPLLGGAILEYFWWGAVFLISVPVMILLLAVGPFLLPEYRDPNAGKPDVLSAALASAAVLSIIYGLKLIAQDGVSVAAALSVLAGLVIGTAFVRRQKQLADPLIDLRLFAIPRFRASLVLYGGAILLLFGAFLFLPQYLQLVLGLSPLRGGLWMLPWAVGFVLGSVLTPALARRIRPAVLMSGGLAVSAVGYFLLAAVGTGTGGLALFAVATFVLTFFGSPLFTLTNDVIIGSAPPERAGAASGISETCAELGGALGIAFFGSIGVAIYRGVLGGALPAGLPTSVTQAAIATLGGAVVAAQQVPGDTGAALLDIARDAFVRGLVLCQVISGIGTLALAVFAWRTFRRVARG